MSEPLATPSSARGRGRGKSRGGLGKYLRARGRGRGSGRPAEFTTRLVLEGEGEGRVTLTEEEEAELVKETAAKYSRRQLGTNADRYKEEEVELDSDGEPILEPEVDLSAFLEKQRISDQAGPILRVTEKKDYDEDDVDTSLAHITSNPSRLTSQTTSRKGKVEEIAWDEGLDEMTREKQAAEATWDLKNRFRAKSERLRTKPVAPPSSSARNRKQEYQEAPALPLPEGAQPKSKTQMEEMEDFLDELLP